MWEQEKEDGWPKLLDIYFEDNQTIAYSFEEAITIEKTGMYYLWFVICDEYLSAATVRGQTTWKNPMGYLPGMMYPHIKFFGVMSLLYMTLAVGWMLLYARHWQVRHAHLLSMAFHLAIVSPINVCGAMCCWTPDQLQIWLDVVACISRGHLPSWQ